MDEFLKVLYEAAAVALTPLLVALIVKMLQRVGLSVQAEQQAKIEKLAQDAILAVEERAVAAAKGKADVIIGDKLEAAVTTLLQKVPNITALEAREIIHAQLPKVGVGAAATFRAVVAAASSPAPEPAGAGS